MQFRSRLPGGTIYCVRVDFIQNGNCIYGQAGYAKYATGTSSIDYDFNTQGTFGGGVPAYGWNTGSGTYGAYAISATFNGEHSPFFTGVCGAWIPAYSPDAASGDRLVWRNVPLARVRNVRGVAGGASSNFTPACEQHRVFTPGNGEDTPDTLATQLSWIDENSNVRCAKVLFTQQGEDVVARVLYVKYVLNKTVDFDFDNGGTAYDCVAKAADDATKSSCGISRLQADIIPEDDGPTQITDEDGNVSILASASGAAVTDLALAGTLSVNGAGPFALDGENEIGVLAVEGIAAAQHPASDYWFLPSRICHVNEFVVSGTGANTIGQLAWRDITQLEKVDATFGKPQIGLTLSGSNTVACPFVPPSFTFFRIKSGYTSLPFLAPVTGELGNGALFAVDEGATLALGGYDHQGNKPINFAIAGSLVVADTLALDGSSTLSGTGTVTAKAIASAGSAKFDGVTLLAPAAGCTLSGSSTVTAAGLTVGEGRTELANGAKLLGGTVSVTGTLAVPQTATIDSLAAPDGTVEVGKDTMITVSGAVAKAGIGTLKVVSDDAKYADWRGEPRPFMKGPGLTRDCVKQVIDPASSMRIWRVSVTDGKTAEEKVLSLQCRLPFYIMFR